MDLFRSCGQVLNFRIVYDKDTGRPKGFGFLEFSNADEAASAVRNLNNHEVMNRTLRVDYSNEAGGGDAGPAASKHEQQTHQQAQHWQQMQQAQQQMGQALPPQPSPQFGAGQSLPPLGVTLPENVSAPDAISRTLSAMDPNELLTVVSHLKNMSNNDPGQVTQLLQQQPQLAYAVFQALLLMGLVDTSILGQLVSTGQQAQAPQPPPQPTSAPYQPPPQQFHPPPPQQPPQFPPHFQQQPMMGTPPVHSHGYPPPPIPQHLQKPPNFSAQEWESVRQVCSLPQQQIDSLDPNQRNSLMQLRQSYGHYFPQMQPQFRPLPGY